MGPTIDALANEYEGRAVIAKLNVDEVGDVAAEYDVKAIPALLFFKDGKIVDRLLGGQAKADIAKKLDSLIGG